MSSKKRFFYIFNLSIVILVLSINSYMLNYFSSFNSIFFTLSIIIICAVLYFVLSKTLIDDMFKIDEKLKEKIEKTMHEINTPVATIQINTEMLETKIDNADNLERLSRINKACDNLLKLYEDMEYYIKKETDNIEIVSFNLDEIIVNCVDKFDDLKDDIKITIDTQSITLTTDKNGFDAMLTNLISNSIKHNKSIQNISIKVEDNILIFQDDGEGIGTQNLYQVFNKYFQVDDTSKGFGIGLNIVKEFCDEHKLEIKIDSSKNGTAFYINLKNIIKDN